MMWSFQNGFDSNVFLGKWGRRTEIPQCYLHNFTTSQIRLLDGSPNHLIPRPTLSLETEGLVGVEFADGGIGGDNESETGWYIRHELRVRWKWAYPMTTPVS
jgi:hypothetical protein